MKMQGFFVSLMAFGFTVGMSTLAQAGPSATCPLVIEVNALRGGSPTVPSSGGTKNITAKARIAKGSDSNNDGSIATTLTVTNDRNGAAPSASVTLVVGKGGQGAKFGIPFEASDCPAGGIVTFTATFTGTATSNGATCVGTRDLTKTCK